MDKQKAEAFSRISGYRSDQKASYLSLSSLICTPINNTNNHTLISGLMEEIKRHYSFENTFLQRKCSIKYYLSTSHHPSQKCLNQTICIKLPSYNVPITFQHPADLYYFATSGLQVSVCPLPPSFSSTQANNSSQSYKQYKTRQAIHRIW